MTDTDDTESGLEKAPRARSGRSGYGFEIKKNFHKAANEWLEDESRQTGLFSECRVPQKPTQAELIA